MIDTQRVIRTCGVIERGRKRERERWRKSLCEFEERIRDT